MTDQVKHHPIRKVIIFHTGLAEKCTGAPLSEGASHEELALSILFFYSQAHDEDDDVKTGNNSNLLVKDDSSYSHEDAIQFLGLCLALYTLPQTIGPDLEVPLHSHKDRAAVVQLHDSMLVFESLESVCNYNNNNDHSSHHNDIVVVAHVSRRSSRSWSSFDTAGGTATAVAAALRRQYRTFALHCGGGIARRLSMATNDSIYFYNNNNNNNSEEEENDHHQHDHQLRNDNRCYPGMSQMYSMLKEQRRLIQKSLRYDPTHDPSSCDIEQQLQGLQKSIDLLYRELPICRLRQNLRIHFGAFWNEMPPLQQPYGVCRNVVEMIPQPIPQLSGNHTRFVPPCDDRLNHHMDLIRAGTEVLLDTIASNNNNATGHQAHFLGMSCFSCDKLLITRMLEDSGCDIHVETAHLLKTYIASFRYRMELESGCHAALFSIDNDAGDGRGRSSNAVQADLRPIAYPLSQGMRDRKDGVVTKSSIGFLSPPPLSMQSVLNETNALFYGADKNCRVWAPPICLKSNRGGPNENCDPHYVDARVCCYHIDDLSFLFYFQPKLSANTDDEWSFQQLFIEIEASISVCIGPILKALPCAPNKSVRNMDSMDKCAWNQPGIDVIHVDRFDLSVVIYSDDNLDRERDPSPKRKGNKASSMPWLQQAKPSHSRSGTDTSIASIGSANGLEPTLDCRHLLASRMSLDSLLAIEDAMNEILERKAGRDTLEPDESYEMCTLLTGRWVYATATDSKELYIVLDAAFFVTLADAQNAIHCIRRELLKEDKD